MSNEKRKCCSCNEIKLSSEFYVYRCNGRKNNKRFDSRCIPCSLKRKAEWLSKNLEKAKKDRAAYYAANKLKELQQMAKYKSEHRKELCEYAKNYSKADPARRKLQRIVSEHKRREKGFDKNNILVKEAILQTLNDYRFGDKFIDAYSGKLISKPTIDHIIPLSKGGSNSADNMCVTSKSNNASKRDKTLLVWMCERAKLCREA